MERLPPVGGYEASGTRSPSKPIPVGCYGGTVPRWLAFLTAVPFAYLVWRLGIAHLRVLSGPAPGSLEDRVAGLIAARVVPDYRDDPDAHQHEHQGPVPAGARLHLLLPLWFQLVAAAPLLGATFRPRHDGSDGSCSGREERQGRRGGGRGEAVRLRPAPEVELELIVPVRGGRVAAHPGRDHTEAPFEVPQVPHPAPGRDHRRTEPERAVETALGHGLLVAPEGDVGSGEQRLQPGDRGERVRA